MNNLNIAKVIFFWIKNYIVNFFVYMLVYVTYIMNDKVYNFEFEGDTHKVKLNTQPLDTIMYLYQEELNVGDSEKVDEDYMESYRIRYLKANKLRQLRITNIKGDELVLKQ